MAKFKLVYNKTNKDSKLNGSYTGIPGDEDKEITIANLAGAKLVYLDNKTKEIKASTTGIPAEKDQVVCTLKALEETGDEIKAAAETTTSTTNNVAEQAAKTEPTT